MSRYLEKTYLGVDKSKNGKDLTAMSVIIIDGWHNTNIIATATGKNTTECLDQLSEYIKGDLEQVKRTMLEDTTKVDVVYSLRGGRPFNPPCFKECDIPGCDMHQKHCGENSYPVWSRCSGCLYYFLNRERLIEREKNK